MKKALLGVHNSGDRWLLWGFTAALVFLAIGILWSPKQRREPAAKDSRDDEARLRRSEQAYREQRLIRVIRSFGLVLLRDFATDRLGVSFYGTIGRPPPPLWTAAPDRFDRLDRMIFSGGQGREYQYTRSFRELIVREHPADSADFGPEVRRRATWTDAKILLLTSSIFPFWLVPHLLVSLFTRPKPPPVESAKAAA